MVCPTCEAENREGAKFCTACGTPLALVCPSCGSGYEPGERFCAECGGSLGAAGPPAPPVTTGAVRSLPEAGGAVAELRVVSVLFVDLVGFTALSESREAEDVRELLGRYFDSARTVVERHGGTIEKFIGDAVMAVWGVPVAREDDAERAVRAALEVVASVEVLGESIGADQLRARAGVVTGQVAALESPGEGLVVGDRVNTASRVQSAAAPGTVLADEVTRQVTSAAILFEDAGEHSVKGKAEPLRLWRAVRVLGGVGGSDREQGLDAGFIGRDGDLRLLRELFHGALERRSARLVAVTAEAGMGKSRLRREFFNYIDGLSDTILWHLGRCLSHGDGIAYWALTEMVRQRLGIAEDASEDEARAKLEAGLERWVPAAGDREFISPRLGALLGVAEPGLGREELFAGWRMFFERLAEHEPIVLVFEDVQWADSGLLDFIEQLLDWSAQLPIFILTLARPEMPAGREGWPAGRRGVTLLALEPLDERSMDELLAGLVEGLPAAAAQRIVERAQGVPLFAIETVRALAARGALREREGGWLVLDGELGELDVPASLSSLLSARLDALEPAERGLVKAMCVFGGSFPRSAAAGLGEVGEHELDAVLASLVRKQVLAIRTDRLSPDRGQYAFAQSLLRAVAYQMLSRQERKPRHLAAAEHLQAAFPNDGEEVAEVIAAHLLDAYRAAGEDEDAGELRRRALAALRRAAQRAASIGAPEAAERSYLSATDLADDELERAELLCAAGEMAIQSGRSEYALELLEAAQAGYSAAGRDREAAGLAPEIATALTRLGRLQEAVERLTAALEALGDAPLGPEAAAITGRLGQAYVWLGDYAAAAPLLETALTISEASELRSELTYSLNFKSSMLSRQGRISEARFLMEGAVEIAEQHGLLRELTVAQGNLSNLALLWDMPDAAQQLESALTSDRRRGDRHGESVSAGNLMARWLLDGRWEQSAQLASDLLEHGEQRPGSEYVRSQLALLCALRGEPAAARAQLEQLGAWSGGDNEELLANHGADTVTVLVAEGDLEGGLEGGRALLPHAIATLGASHDAVRQAWPETAAAALALGRAEVAHELLGLVAEHPPGHVPPYLRAQLARFGALASALENGPEDEIVAGLARAIESFERLGFPYWLAVTRTDLAAWLIEQGRAAAVGAALEQAVDALRGLGAKPALARAEELQRSTASAPGREQSPVL